MIRIINNQRYVKLSAREQRRTLERVLALAGYPNWDLGVLFTGNTKIRGLNRQYRNKDKPTDILSFPFYTVTTPNQLPTPRDGEEQYLGDIVISIPYVQAYCRDERIPLLQHLPRLYTHGICHLLGYDHETDPDYHRMALVENNILKRFWEERKNDKV
ncbi:hypothetical protein IWQ61_002290 [Dispira simplex]|nr:hypothetical protein IWQ61_002290 [Dispira simplex]